MDAAAWSKAAQRARKVMTNHMWQERRKLMEGLQSRVREGLQVSIAAAERVVVMEAPMLLGELVNRIAPFVNSPPTQTIYQRKR